MSARHPGRSESTGETPLPSQIPAVPPPEPQAPSSSERSVRGTVLKHYDIPRGGDPPVLQVCRKWGNVKVQLALSLGTEWVTVTGASQSRKSRLSRVREAGTHRAPGRRKPPVLAVLPLTGLQGRGPGQVRTVAGRSHVELSAKFGHTDDVSTLRARATVCRALMGRKRWCARGCRDRSPRPTGTPLTGTPPRLAAHLSPGPRVPAPCHLTGPQAAGTHVRGPASRGAALLARRCSRSLLARPGGLPAPEADHGASLDARPTLGRTLRSKAQSGGGE